MTTPIPRPDIPALTPGETAYELPTGEIVTVSVLQVPIPDESQPENTHVGFTVTGRWLDAAGVEQIVADGFRPGTHPARLPRQSHSVQLGVLAGGVDLPTVLEGYRQAALAAWPGYLAAVRALRGIPFVTPALSA